MSTIDRMSDLAPHVPTPGMRVDGSPIAGHDWEEVAGAMAQLQTAGGQLLRGMYCHDTRALRQALARLNGEAMFELSIAERPRLVPPADVGRVALAAMQAFVARGYCATCEGRGWLMQDELRVQCPECSGQGHVEPNVPQLLGAAGAEITHDAGWLLERLHDRLQAWHNNAMGALHNQLRNRGLADEDQTG